MDAIILAGGLGTRLREAVAGIPKPMAPVKGKPFMWYILKFLTQSEINRVFISAGYRAEVIFEYFGEIFENLELKYVIEDEPLGTGGAIKKAAKALTVNDFMVINGDTWFPVDTEQMIEFHQSNKAAITIALKEMTDFDRYGSVELASSRITAFHEKSFCKQGLINGGVYLVNRDYLNSVATPEKFSFEKDVLEKLAGNSGLYGFVSDAPFLDIGIPEDYKKAGSYFRND